MAARLTVSVPQTFCLIFYALNSPSNPGEIHDRHETPISPT